MGWPRIMVDHPENNLPFLDGIKYKGGLLLDLHEAWKRSDTQYMIDDDDVLHFGKSDHHHAYCNRIRTYRLDYSTTWAYSRGSLNYSATCVACSQLVLAASTHFLLTFK